MFHQSLSSSVMFMQVQHLVSSHSASQWISLVVLVAGRSAFWVIPAQLSNWLRIFGTDSGILWHVRETLHCVHMSQLLYLLHWIVFCRKCHNFRQVPCLSWCASDEELFGVLLVTPSSSRNQPATCFYFESLEYDCGWLLDNHVISWGPVDHHSASD